MRGHWGYPGWGYVGLLSVELRTGTSAGVEDCQEGHLSCVREGGAIIDGSVHCEVVIAGSETGGGGDGVNDIFIIGS